MPVDVASAVATWGPLLKPSASSTEGKAEDCISAVPTARRHFASFEDLILAPCMDLKGVEASVASGRITRTNVEIESFVEDSSSVDELQVTVITVSSNIVFVSVTGIAVSVTIA